MTLPPGEGAAPPARPAQRAGERREGDASVGAPPPSGSSSIIERRFDDGSRLTFEGRVLLFAVLAGLPGAVVALALLWAEDHSAKVRWTLALFIVGGWLGFAFALRERVTRPLQTLSNMLAALREGDFSMRIRGAKRDDTLGLAFLEVNQLGETLRAQRLGAMEAAALLGTVMEEIDVAVFAFDEDQRVVLVNRGGERLLDRPAPELLGRDAREIGLGEYLGGEAPRTIDVAFPGAAGRWELRRTTFRQGGRPHGLLVLADLSRALREEERLAWQRLIRVLSHEINNSLAPIKSIAGSLQHLLLREPKPPDWDDDFRQGLGVIASRSESLSRFMQAYAKLARLPRPTLRPLDVETWVRRVTRLETRQRVEVRAGPPLVLLADGDQLDQLLINLIKNAVEAARPAGAVAVGWTTDGTTVEVCVEDEGPGVSDTANLFVPFFTTKPEGSGIGLVLSRQIAEGHGGTLTLENRPDALRGAVARLRLPLRAPEDVAVSA